MEEKWRESFERGSDFLEADSCCSRPFIGEKQILYFVGDDSESLIVSNISIIYFITIIHNNIMYQLTGCYAIQIKTRCET